MDVDGKASGELFWDDGDSVGRYLFILICTLYTLNNEILSVLYKIVIYFQTLSQMGNISKQNFLLKRYGHKDNVS